MKKEKPLHITLKALKLTERANEEGIAYRTAQKNKHRFACVEILMGKNKTVKRYLDAKTTDLLRASGLFNDKDFKF